jgi:cytochrome c553
MVRIAVKMCALVCFAFIASFSFSADTGAALFNESCAKCHGVDGTANTPARKKMAVANLCDKAHVEMTDAVMFDTIARGTRHKEYPHSFLYTGMSEQQIHSLVAHIRTLQKKAK